MAIADWLKATFGPEAGKEPHVDATINSILSKPLKTFKKTNHARDISG